jgi:hypothetical protein
MMLLLKRVLYGMIMGWNQPDPLKNIPKDVEVLHWNEQK